MRRPRWILSLVSPSCLLLAWEAASRFGWLNPLLFPPPSRAFADLRVLIASGYLAKALYASLFRVVCGFAIAVTVGVALGAAMARLRLVNELLDPIVEILRPISPLALYPLAILWLGIGDGSKIFIPLTIEPQPI
jgi:ABC-type nitrate/sulfonate/bicarbonate transport system permease component